MSSDLPSAAVLRGISDETVVRALLDAQRATRAELATATGLSKPTVAEAVRRLEGKGLVRDTGERTAGRGGVGTFYAPSGAAAGLALAVLVAPEGIVVETVDASGVSTSRAERPVQRHDSAQVVRRHLRAAVRETATAQPDRPILLATVSAADPVDRATGRLVQLPDAPFLVGELDPRAVLSPLVAGPVTVDNDVNWAARYEHTQRAQDDFVYLYLGDGLGCAVVADGAVRRGHSGLAGEVAHLVTTGPDGRAMAFTSVFAELGLRRPRSTAIDGHALVAALGDRSMLQAVSTAVAGVISAMVALCDPAAVVLAGTWGTDARLLAALQATTGRSARPVAVEGAHDPTLASLSGARTAAVDGLRDLVAARSRA